VLYQTEGNRVTGNLKSKTLRRCVYGSGPYVQRAGATDNNEIPPIAHVGLDFADATPAIAAAIDR